MNTDLYAAGLCYALGCSITDLRTREISPRFTAAFGLLGICGTFLSGRSWTDLAGALLPGICILAISFAAPESIGSGDGAALCVSAFYLTRAQMYASLAAGFMLTACFAAILFAAGKHRHTEIPFLPFLLAGEVIVFQL